MTSPASRPQAAIAARQQGEHRLRSENLAFDIDVWYPPLAEHTFRTQFLPLKRCEAEAIMSHYNASWRGIHQQLTESTVRTLLELEARIDHALKMNFSSRGAFLRLCGRSPKDGEPTDVAARAKIWASYQEALETMVQKEYQPLNGNTRVAAIARTDSWLRIQTGSDAMSLILTSERVFSDMIDWLQYGEPEQIVLREWSDSFDLSSEFRCYIEHGVLLGISQYDTYAKYAVLQDPCQRAMLIQAVVSEWMKLKDCIETIDGSYCADFGVDMKEGTAQFIELSTFRRCTGPALFAWAPSDAPPQLVCLDRDDVQDDLLSTVVQKEEIAKDAVLRVRSKDIPNIGDLVEVNWDLRWSKERVDTPRPYRDLYASAIPTKIDLASMIRGWLLDSLKWKESFHDLFVYGTLKRNCHWHSKYLSESQFIGQATTAEPQSLVIGECGVPYLIQTKPKTQEENAKPVRGELWRVSNETLRGIDEYEGIQKHHYTREVITVFVQNNDGNSRLGTGRNAFCYFYALKEGASDVDLSLLEAERISEYTAEQQKKRYKPIHHIQVKQLEYLGEDATT